MPDEYFTKDPSKSDGTSVYCRKCRSEVRVDGSKRRISRELMSIVQEMEAPILATLAAYAGAGGTNLPHQTEALEKIIMLLGGVNGFAAFYVANIMAAPPGSVIRERMLNRLLTAIQIVSDDTRVQKPIKDMRDEEIVATLGQYGLTVTPAEVRSAVESNHPDDDGTGQ